MKNTRPLQMQSSAKEPLTKRSTDLAVLVWSCWPRAQSYLQKRIEECNGKPKRHPIWIHPNWSLHWASPRMKGVGSCSKKMSKSSLFTDWQQWQIKLIKYLMFSSHQSIFHKFNPTRVTQVVYGCMAAVLGAFLLFLGLRKVVHWQEMANGASYSSRIKKGPNAPKMT